MLDVEYFSLVSMARRGFKCVPVSGRYGLFGSLYLNKLVIWDRRPKEQVILLVAKVKKPNPAEMARVGPTFWYSRVKNCFK